MEHILSTTWSMGYNLIGVCPQRWGLFIFGGIGAAIVVSNSQLWHYPQIENIKHFDLNVVSEWVEELCGGKQTAKEDSC